MSKPVTPATLADATTIANGNTTDPHAGETLAQLAAYGDTSDVRMSLAVRIVRNGKSAPNAAGALERLLAGGSVAIPERERTEKTPAAAPKAPKAPKSGNPNAHVRLARSNARVQARVNTPAGLSERDFFAHVEAVGRATGNRVPRWISAGARGRTIPVRTQA